LVELTNVSKKYDNGTIALRGVNLKIEKGDFLFLIGASGSGKSTLIKLLLKEEEASSGEVFVNGYDINNLRQKEVPFLRRSMGMVFQDFRLLPNKNVYDNVAFAMQIIEAMPREIKRRVPLVLALVGLGKKGNAFPSQLSGGEQQRVALARAIVNNPALLIADEPTGNLDPETSWDIIKLLCDINQRGTTVIVATHEKAIVDAFQKRVVAIERGRIIRDQIRGLYTYET
jgi:cell division transport system ATP-binding protein